MDKVSVALQVFFSEPFWIGIVERVKEERLEAARVVFGAEPKDYEVWEVLLRNYERLRFSPAVEAEVKEKKSNPKKMQRDIHREMNHTGMGTKSQQALKLLQEETKMVRQRHTKEQREAEKDFQFQLKQQKRKEKHRGR